MPLFSLHPSSVTQPAFNPRRWLCPLWLLLSLLLLSACGTYEGYYPQAAEKAEANILPTNYRAEIIAFLPTYLNNPNNIRDPFIAEPELKPTAGGDRYAVCLRFNARKNGGAYEGSKDRLVYFLSGRLDTMVEARQDECKAAKYQPFPELERLRR